MVLIVFIVFKSNFDFRKFLKLPKTAELAKVYNKNKNTTEITETRRITKIIESKRK